MTVAPVFVTVDPPRTPKGAAVPKLIACALIRKGNAIVHATLHRNLIFVLRISTSSSLQGITTGKKNVVKG